MNIEECEKEIRAMKREFRKLKSEHNEELIMIHNDAVKDCQKVFRKYFSQHLSISEAKYFEVPCSKMIIINAEFEELKW